MTYKIFHDLRVKHCQHPLDRKALVALEKTPGLSLLLKKISEYGVDRLLRIQILGNAFRITSRNFPELYNVFVKTCQVLDISPLPDLYLSRGKGHIDIFSIGVENPLIVLNLEGLEWLSDKELLFILGHELGRVKGQYLQYQQMAVVMPIVKTLISSTTFGFGGLAASGVEVALYNWIIMASFTGDRVGLLACQDVDTAIAALMKMGGLPDEYLNPSTMQEFCDQAREFNIEEMDRLDKVAKIFSFMEYTIPWGVMRASELLKWVDEGAYDRWMQWGNSKLLEGSQAADEANQPDDEDWDF